VVFVGTIGEFFGCVVVCWFGCGLGGAVCRGDIEFLLGQDFGGFFNY